MGTTIEDAQRRLEKRLMKAGSGVSGVGIGADGDEPVLRVYASRSGADRVPHQWEGHRVIVVESDGFRAQGPKDRGDR
ncbi:MAG: hypothetical protein R3195_01900 [Gemmatimonadota bacterium]|nr:hypothetical protein [Gemmatimonadota bacterium]